jgi:type IV pilus assembly protein PilY1
VVYVGANDGMLHAFDAQMTTCRGGGAVCGRAQRHTYLGPGWKAGGERPQGAERQLPICNRYYVNATPFARDVDFKRAGGTIESNPDSHDWRSLLVFGLGKGGRSYVALDITDTPDNVDY